LPEDQSSEDQNINVRVLNVGRILLCPICVLLYWNNGEHGHGIITSLLEIGHSLTWSIIFYACM